MEFLKEPELQDINGGDAYAIICGDEMVISCNPDSSFDGTCESSDVAYLDFDQPTC